MIAINIIASSISLVISSFVIIDFINIYIKTIIGLKKVNKIL